MKLPGLITVLIVHAAVVLGGVYAMLIAFGDELEKELDRESQRIERNIERDFDRVRRDVRRDLDRRLPAATPP